jgi:hypothetical protein
VGVTGSIPVIGSKIESCVRAVEKVQSQRIGNINTVAMRVSTNISTRIILEDGERAKKQA